MRLARFAACLAALFVVSFSVETYAAGALATGQCGAFGYAYDDDSPEAAALRARAQCKGRDCKVVTMFRRTCAAFAIDGRNACGPNGWGQAATMQQAKLAATESCTRFGGRNCVTRVWLCDKRG